MPAMTLRLAVLAVAVVAAAACDPHEASPTTYTGFATGPQRSEAFRVSGRVTTIMGSVLAEAWLHAVSSAGTFDVLTDAGGMYVVSAVGDTSISVEKDGYDTVAKSVTVSRDEVIDIMLPRSDAAGVAGDYTLTFTSSASCLLPPEAMRRVYQVTVHEVEPLLLVSMKGSQFVGFDGIPGFPGARDGKAVVFQLSDGVAGTHLVERIPSIGDLGFSGTATGTIAGPTITAVFAGRLRLDPWFLPGAQKAECQASDHRLEFMRTGSR